MFEALVYHKIPHSGDDFYAPTDLLCTLPIRKLDALARLNFTVDKDPVAEQCSIVLHY